MTSVTLPGQLELPTVVDHQATPEQHPRYWKDQHWRGDGFEPRDVQIAKLLRSYEERPTSETWSRTQALAAEILR